QGADALAITTNFIHHGLIVDDADEPNDDATLATVIPNFGFIVSGRVLNLYNEDWYSFTLTESTKLLTVSATFDRSIYPTTFLTMQLLNAANSVIATGAAVTGTDSTLAVAGPLAAGVYRVPVALASGGPLLSYSLQAFSELV